jgi:hypothetical protein
MTTKFGIERNYKHVLKFRMKRKYVYRISKTDTSISHLPHVLSSHCKMKCRAANYGHEQHIDTAVINYKACRNWTRHAIMSEHHNVCKTGLQGSRFTSSVAFIYTDDDGQTISSAVYRNKRNKSPAPQTRRQRTILQNVAPLKIII